MCEVNIMHQKVIGIFLFIPQVMTAHDIDMNKVLLLLMTPLHKTVLAATDQHDMQQDYDMHLSN